MKLKTVNKRLMVFLALSLILLPSIIYVQAVSYGRYEYYDVNEDQWNAVYQYNILSQTFNVTTSHEIVYVRLLIGKVGNNIGQAIISITETESGIPTNYLTSGSIDADKVITAYAMDWYRINLANVIQLNASTQYAIVLSSPQGNFTADDFIFWGSDDSSPTYTGGNFLNSTDGGEHWISDTGKDFLFEEWGYVYALPFLTAFPEFFTAISAGIIVTLLGFGFRDVGASFGGHALAGFIIGGSMGLIMCAQSGLIPVWFVILVFTLGGLGFYFWFRGG